MMSCWIVFDVRLRRAPMAAGGWVARVPNRAAPISGCQSPVPFREEGLGVPSSGLVRVRPRTVTAKSP